MRVRKTLYGRGCGMARDLQKLIKICALKNCIRVCPCKIVVHENRVFRGAAGYYSSKTKYLANNTMRIYIQNIIKGGGAARRSNKNAF